jgi:hypothetical protein
MSDEKEYDVAGASSPRHHHLWGRIKWASRAALGEGLELLLDRARRWQAIHERERSDPRRRQAALAYQRVAVRALRDTLGRVDRLYRRAVQPRDGDIDELRSFVDWLDSNPEHWRDGLTASDVLELEAFAGRLRRPAEADSRPPNAVP